MSPEQSSNWWDKFNPKTLRERRRRAAEFMSVLRQHYFYEEYQGNVKGLFEQLDRLQAGQHGERLFRVSGAEGDTLVGFSRDVESMYLPKKELRIFINRFTYHPTRDNGKLLHSYDCMVNFAKEKVAVNYGTEETVRYQEEFPEPVPAAGTPPRITIPLKRELPVVRFGLASAKGYKRPVAGSWEKSDSPLWLENQCQWTKEVADLLERVEVRRDEEAQPHQG